MRIYLILFMIHTPSIRIALLFAACAHYSKVSYTSETRIQIKNKSGTPSSLVSRTHYTTHLLWQKMIDNDDVIYVLLTVTVSYIMAVLVSFKVKGAIHLNWEEIVYLELKLYVRFLEYFS